MSDRQSSKLKIQLMLDAGKSWRDISMQTKIPVDVLKDIIRSFPGVRGLMHEEVKRLDEMYRQVLKGKG